MDDAIRLYEAGSIRRRDGALFYPQINVDYARALIAKTNRMWEHDPEVKKIFGEAAKLLKEARPHVPRFEQFNLDLFALSLWKSEQISREDAIEMLEDARENSPYEGHIYLRLANVLSEDKTDQTKALQYARRAKELDAYGATLTLANILIDQGKFNEALKELSNFDPKLEKDQIVADILRARAYSGDRRFDQARGILTPLTDNPFAMSAAVQNEISAANSALFQQQYETGKTFLRAAEGLIKKARSSRTFNLSNEYYTKLESQISVLQERLS